MSSSRTGAPVAYLPSKEKKRVRFPCPAQDLGYNELMKNWLVKLKSEKLVGIGLGVIIIGAILFRFIHFEKRFHFTGDQALASARAYEIWQNKELTLVGIPITSWTYEGKSAHVSSTAYYIQLIPLLLSGFEPRVASMIMAGGAVLMTAVLYMGVKKLTKSKTVGLVMAAIYGLLPLYIDYSIFLWNPNWQLLLAPVAIFLMGWYEEKKRPIILGLAGLVLGLMLTLHFQFGLVVFGLMIIYFLVLKKRHSLSDFWYLLGGLGVGFSPMILAEIKTGFYNTKILGAILGQLLTSKNGVNFLGGIAPHYLMVSGLFVTLGLVIWGRKYLNKVLVGGLILVLLVIDMVIYLPQPAQAWQLPIGWFYQNELTVHEIMVEKKLTNFNILNLAYIEPLANVQKYLLQVNEPQIYKLLANDYYVNDYLFVMAKNWEEVTTAENYEVRELVGSLVESWPIGEGYELFLLERKVKSDG